MSVFFLMAAEYDVCEHYLKKKKNSWRISIWKKKKKKDERSRSIYAPHCASSLGHCRGFGANCLSYACSNLTKKKKKLMVLARSSFQRKRRMRTKMTMVLVVVLASFYDDEFVRLGFEFGRVSLPKTFVSPK